MGKHGKAVKDGGRMVRDDSESLRKGAVKKNPAKSKQKPIIKTATADVESVVPLKIQQLALNIFKDTFPDVLASDSLALLLQEVKGRLYERDFEGAFGRQDYLEAYAVRWSPSRVLCYQSILVDLLQYLSEIFPACQSEKGTGVSSLRAIAFGGGAAEVVAFGAFLRYVHNTALPQTTHRADLNLDGLTITDAVSRLSSSKNGSSSVSPGIDLVLVDSADWKDVSQKLSRGLTTTPILSKYANAAARDANTPLLDIASLKSTFVMENALELDRQRLLDLVGEEKALITLLFTLNELYTASISNTTKFLLNMTSVVKPGTLLLVVDSPGSYSETAVGPAGDKEAPKKYPMKWLLEHALLATETPRGQESLISLWEKVASDDSRWFRIHESLRYPIPIENMRYQLHLYRRI
ncbi:hypothetical protein BKA64DRAFT_419139 [Cadophora sp. MPI-SDFR-AT-0126]|nr:hypothetical protein BKA64DRAFT_419139 [Leotiomycetes sp. MPI-SDFR-AT-0126]